MTILLLSQDDETPMTKGFTKPLKTRPTGASAPVSATASGQIQQGGR